MNKKLTCAVCIAAMALSFTGCGKKKEVKTEKTETATNVTVYTAQKTDMNDLVTYTGEIRASEESSVSAKASGTARSVNADIGDFVSAGAVLLTIDDTDYRLQYNQAKAAHNSAVASYNSATNGSVKRNDNQLKAALDAAQLDFNDAQQNYDRQKTLYDMGAISEIEFNGAKTRLENSKLNLDNAKSNYNLTKDVLNGETEATAKAAVDSAKAALDIAQHALTNTTVTAPISGYISAKNINKGQMVSPGTPLFTIKSTNTVDGEINVTESVIPYVHVGTKADISVKSAGIDNIEGKVSVVNPVKNAQTGMYTVRIEISNKDGKLKEGMFAEISLVTREEKNIITIPAEAVMQSGDELYVYVAEGNTAKKVTVTTGISNDELTEITSGINEGDSVIVSGKEYISEKNNKIKIVSE